MSLGHISVGSDPLPTAPASPENGELEAQDLPIHSHIPHIESSFPYPTPPPSSQSSIHRPSRGESGVSGEKRTRSIQDGPKELESASERLRRHTFTAASPLSNVTVASTVTASHLSNPAAELSSSSTSSPLITQPSASRRPSVSLPNKESSGLTQGVSSPPQSQSTPSQTPPQTPRNRSQEGKRTGTATPSKSGGPNGATIGPVLGKLSVEISEGKGLRSSLDPYVVCQFQCAEYISEGPKNAEAENGPGLGRGPAGIAIKRTPSDRGQPQAIPMRSRQSSRTGRDMVGSFHETTDPKWEHKAVL
jgi:serine/threonine protein kinase SCH9